MFATESCSDPCPLITGTRFRVVDQLFQASSFQENHPPHGARLDGPSWCARAENESNSWIEVLFGTDVVITAIQTSGRENFYVESILVYYGQVGQELQNITVDQEFRMPNVGIIDTHFYFVCAQ